MSRLLSALAALLVLFGSWIPLAVLAIVTQASTWMPGWIQFVVIMGYTVGAAAATVWLFDHWPTRRRQP